MKHESYALYPHQVTGVEFLTRRGSAILGDDMGLGKTRQAIIALKESAASGGDSRDIPNPTGAILFGLGKPTAVRRGIP